MRKEKKVNAQLKSPSKGSAHKRVKKAVVKNAASTTVVSKLPVKKTYPSTLNDEMQADITLSDAIFSYQSADDKNVLSIIDAVRTGISSKDFIRIVDDIPFSLAEWSDYLQLSQRTIQRNQKEKKPFQPIQSERIIELTMLYNYGVNVFGDKENFDTWLNLKSIALGGRSPKELLDTKFGVGMVKDELGRIEHGILA